MHHTFHSGKPEAERALRAKMILDRLIHVGDMPMEKTRYSTKLFAEEVMPHLRNMWPEYEDDNRFWIDPLDKRATPGPISERKADGEA